MLEDRIKIYVTSFFEEVSGSNTYIKVKWKDGREISFIVDCGLFQEKPHNHINLEKFKYNADKIYFAIATHVHTDHIGRFPYLVKSGFSGIIYTSYESALLMPTVLNETFERLEDEYRIDIKKYREERSRAILRKLNEKGRGRKDKPRNEKCCKKNCCNESKPFLIYDRNDIDETLKKVSIQRLNESFSPCPGVDVTFYPNAHISGAVITVVKIYDDYEELNLLFTGDLGMNNPVTKVETLVPEEVCNSIDVVISESTYGSSEYSKNTEKERKIHKEIIKRVSEKNGTIVYMSNALERPLRLGVDIKEMQNEKDMKNVLQNFKIFFDSTFGIKCFRKYLKLYGKEYLPDNFKLIDKETRDGIISSKEPKMIICTSPRFYQGSFVNYGKKMLEDPNVTLIFVAYITDDIRNIISLPTGTKIKYLDEKIVLRCKMYQFGYYSSHVSTDDMDLFLNQFKNAKVIMFNHGTQDSRTIYSKRYKTDSNITHNLLYGKTVMITKKGIEKYF